MSTYFAWVAIFIERKIRTEYKFSVVLESMLTDCQPLWPLFQGTYVSI